MGHCKGLTKAGAQCKCLVTGDTDYCHLHESQAGRQQSSKQAGQKPAGQGRASLCGGHRRNKEPCQRVVRDGTGYCYQHRSQAKGQQGSDPALHKAADSTPASACKGSKLNGEPCHRVVDNSIGYCHDHVEQAKEQPVRAKPSARRRAETCAALVQSGHQCDGTIELHSLFCKQHGPDAQVVGKPGLIYVARSTSALLHAALLTGPALHADIGLQAAMR
jgi:hypothetical protein